jgi:outer membrane lipoprotein-sorting protein
MTTLFPSVEDLPDRAGRRDARRRLARRLAGFACAAGMAFGLSAAASDAVTAPARLSAAQIVTKHIAARGGLAAWHDVQSMAWTGKMEAGTGDSPARSARYARAAMAPKKKSELAAAQAEEKPPEAEKQVQLPFVLEMKRPTLSRLEIEFNGKTAVQVYDGKSGWKLRPFLNRDDWEPFTQEELKASAGKWELDGPLLDAAAKGTKVELEGVEPVDGSDAYRLKLTLKGGDVQHIWIDARSFLDVKVEGTARRMDGKVRKVFVAQRDFRAEQGVMVPHLLETTVEGYPDKHRMTIEKVSLNPVLSDALFSKAKPGGA